MEERRNNNIKKQNYASADPTMYQFSYSDIANDVEFIGFCVSSKVKVYKDERVKFKWLNLKRRKLMDLLHISYTRRFRFLLQKKFDDHKSSSLLFSFFAIPFSSRVLCLLGYHFMTRIKSTKPAFSDDVVSDVCIVFLPSSVSKPLMAVQDPSYSAMGCGEDGSGRVRSIITTCKKQLMRFNENGRKVQDMDDTVNDLVLLPHAYDFDIYEDERKPTSCIYIRIIIKFLKIAQSYFLERDKIMCFRKGQDHVYMAI
ncbi:hypothetical protein Tco_0070854 [Tanacetum coccineum]